MGRECSSHSWMVTEASGFRLRKSLEPFWFGRGLCCLVGTTMDTASTSLRPRFPTGDAMTYHLGAFQKRMPPIWVLLDQ